MDREEFFEEILEKKRIRTVFQPIVSLQNGSIFGHEALSRITVPSCEISIEELFQIAFERDKLWELEQLCRIRALESTSAHRIDTMLFLNVDPNIIHAPGFKEGFTIDKLKQYGLSPQNIVFEITEKRNVSDKNAFVSSVRHYQDQHFQIAIDDFGSGHSGLNRVCALSPQFLKIDMNLIRDIDSDSVKYSAVSAMVQFCKKMSIPVIAEGIETKEELKVLILLGVEFGQGYYLGRPKETFSSLDQERKLEIKESYNKSDLFYAPSFSSKIVDLGCKKQTVQLHVKSKEIFEKMSKDLSVTEFFVVDVNEQVCGILTRKYLIEKFSGAYGYNLNFRTVASDLMLKNHLCVEESMVVDKVAELAMSRAQECVYDAIAVVRNGQYLKTVMVKDLLLASIHSQVQNAFEKNPLTGLPGNNQIQQVINTTFSQTTPCSIIYLDIDNFKAYNDAYGFSNGDFMLKALADTLKRCCRKNDFCGHIGGDDFIIVSFSHNIPELCDNIFKEFENDIQKLYSPFDWEQGYIVSKNRHGFIENFPIATLSIAAVTNKSFYPSTMEKLSKIIADTKKKCKQKEGNVVVVI